MNAVDGDGGFARELLETFVDSCERELGRIEQSVSSGDLESVRAAAHSLKGASANVRAGAIVEAATKLEAAARTSHLQDVTAKAATLAAEIEVAKIFLSSVA